MGEYTDRETDTTIKRENVDRREFKYFEPANPEYGQQDYERMESLNNGNWSFIGIIAEATIKVDDHLQTVHSGGLWGIESDSGDDYIKSVEHGELADLKNQLETMGVDVSGFDAEFSDE